MLDVVVVVPNLNGSLFLAETLSAIAPAGGRLEIATVVVDNGSTDDSVAKIEENFPAVRVIANPQNLGFAVACNQGGKSESSRYVLLLNSDVTLEPQSLELLVACMDSHERLAALTPRMTWPDGRHQGRKLPAHPPGDVVPIPTISGTCLLLRRSVLDAIGWLDERFFFYNEDLDLSLRLRKAGWTIACHRAITARHVEGRATGSSPEIRARAIFEGYRGGILLVDKHYPWASWAARLGIAALLEGQAFRLALKRTLGRPLSDRDVALSLCLKLASVARNGI